MAEGSVVVEKVADQIDHVSDEIGEVAEVTRRLSGRDVSFFVAGAGLGFAAGFGIGYFVMGKRLETKYQKLADEEIAKMRDHYQQLTVALKGEAERRRPLEELVVEKGYTTEGDRYDAAEKAAIAEINAQFPADEDTSEAPSEEVVEAEEVQVEVVRSHNVFASAPTEDVQWDYAAEIARRQSDVPYIIHIDEFRQNERGHDQVTMTYYEQDDILAGPRDEVVDDMDAVIGLGNLGKWGYGSNDPNITYVRNEELHADIEILRDRGSFHETVHAIRHSSEKRRPVNRGFDDD